MLWRHLCLVRAWSAAGLLGGLLCLTAPYAAAQTSRPADPEKSTLPSDVATESVDLLQGNKTGKIDVVARGQGQDKVRLTVHNNSKKRLNVILPPGLVAASTAGQGRGLQSMGLGMFSNRSGSFGQFRSTNAAEGLQSVPVNDAAAGSSVTFPADETLELTVPGVCLNFGLPTPTPKDTFTLMTVDDYTTDSRIRKSLRSLAMLGTSQGVAQAVMWRVCNDVSFEVMNTQAGRVMNEAEIALAARFVEVLDASADPEMVESGDLSEGRIFVRVQGQGALSADAQRLSAQMEKYRLLGLSVRAVDASTLSPSGAPALLVDLTFTDSKIGETRGKLAVSYLDASDRWTPLAKAPLIENSSLAVLDGESLSKALDRTLASALVTVRPSRRTSGSTSFRIDNHFPFTISNVTLKAGPSAGAPIVPFQAVGIGPGRSTILSVQAGSATIESIELNGL